MSDYTTPDPTYTTPDHTPTPTQPTQGQGQWQRNLPTVPAHVTADLALEHLAYAQGDPALAAERLGLPNADVLLGLMALDETIHARAQAVFRFMQLAALLGALSHVQDELLTRVEQLDAKDVGKLYTTMVMAAEALTRAAAPGVPGAAPGNTNITFNLLRLLPPDVRNAMKVLLPAPETAIYAGSANGTNGIGDADEGAA